MMQISRGQATVSFCSLLLPQKESRPNMKRGFNLQITLLKHTDLQHRSTLNAFESNSSTYIGGFRCCLLTHKHKTWEFCALHVCFALYTELLDIILHQSNPNKSKHSISIERPAYNCSESTVFQRPLCSESSHNTWIAAHDNIFRLVVTTLW